MIRPTQFPPEWLLKKSREECEQLLEENRKLREENFEMKLRIKQFTSKHEAKIAAQKEVLYRAIKDQMHSFEGKYYRARKILDSIWEIACRIPETSDTEVHVDDICQILINYYGNYKK